MSASRLLTLQRYRILYAIGPGDAVQAYRDWKSGQATISETSLTYSSQLFEFCRDNQMDVWAISSHQRSELINDGQFRVENRPKKPNKACGLRYHVQQLRYALSLLRSALRYKADLVIIDSGTTHWFFLTLFKLLGIRVVAGMHNVFWPAGYPPKSWIHKLILRLDGWFISRFLDAAYGVSPECGRQVHILAGGRPVTFFQYRAQFRKHDFSGLKLPDYELRPFRVLFASRVERNKGVFDLIDMAAELKLRRPNQVMFDICGGGSILDELRSEVAMRGLDDVVKLHGFLNRPELLRVYEQSHLVIVPTRSDFCEGMPMVCAEAVLSGRPVLSSRVSNALDVLDEAIIEARTDDTEDYVAKIEQILDHRDIYDKCAGACSIASLQFIDRSRGKTAVLGKVLEALRPGWKAAPLVAEPGGLDTVSHSTSSPAK